MHRMFPLVRRRTLSAVQLQLKWTRSLLHKSASAVKNPNSDRPTQSEREVSSDPFGLEYLGLETLVQGLYSKSGDIQIVSKSKDSDSAAGTRQDVENPGIKTDSLENKSSEIPVTDKYKDWFLEKKPNTIGPDSELIRSTDFGFIRFDSDNAAKVQDNDYINYEENEREPPIATKRHQNSVVAEQLTPKSNLDPNAKREPPITTKRHQNSVVAEQLMPMANADPNAKREPPIAAKRHQNIQPSPPPPVITKEPSVAVSEVTPSAYGDPNTRREPTIATQRHHNIQPSQHVPAKEPSVARAKLTPKAHADPNAQTEPPIATKRHENIQPSPPSPVTAKPSVVTAKLTPKANADQNTLPEVKVQPVPRIYEMQDYNKITHADMWNIIKHNVVYQNDFLIAINKPYGLPIHSPSVECRHTLNTFQAELAELGKCEKVYPLHRLDKDATGVLLLAKTEQAADIIKKKFKERQVEKKYITITKTPPHVEHGVIKIPISEGKIGGTSEYRSTLKPDLREYNISTKQSFSREAITKFKVLNSNEDCAFVEINTETGVKHQIRVHLAMGLGCPILGDHKYSHRDKLAPQRLSSGILNRLKISQTKVRHLPLHLHCSHVKFTMPDGFSSNSEPVFVTARPPHFFMHTLRKLYLIKAT